MPNAHISFVYDIHYRVPTSYEPINRPHTDDDLWMREAMTSLGYSGTSALAQIRGYVNELRQALETNWAFTIFVVDSLNDLDGCFTDNIDSTRKWAAYATHGGPYLVMTYDIGNNGIGNMDYATAHETCHLFYATDEYNGITQKSGYLGFMILKALVA